MKPQCVTIQMKSIEQYFHCLFFNWIFFFSILNLAILWSERVNVFIIIFLFLGRFRGMASHPTHPPGPPLTCLRFQVKRRGNTRNTSPILYTERRTWRRWWLHNLCTRNSYHFIRGISVGVQSTAAMITMYLPVSFNDINEIICIGVISQGDISINNAIFT